MNRGVSGWIVVAVFVAVVVTFMLSAHIVPEGNIGVVTRWGAVNREVKPGFGFHKPLSENVIRMNIRTQIFEADASAASSNIQAVSAKIAVNYSLDSEWVSEMFSRVGKKYEDVIIAPAIQNAFKAATSQYVAEDLIIKRDDVCDTAKRNLQAQLAQYHITIESFNVINFDFSPEFNASIEANQVAEQQVELARQQLDKAKVDAETAITQAQAQADAQAALRNTGALTEEYLQYLAITKWDGVLPKVVGDTSPFVDVSQFMNTSTFTVP